jgi:predicted HicB family RNase H-like nuclease
VGHGPNRASSASPYPHDLEGDNAVLTQSTEKYQQILQSARQLFESEPDWVTFFREILGVDGVVRRQFTRLEDLTAFEKSPEFEQIQKWLVKLREQKNATDTESEPTRVITVRLPKSMHEYLRTEAHDLRTSMNKLCISKLLQVIEQDLIPTERSGGTPSRINKPIQQPVTTSVGSGMSTMGGHTSHTSHTTHSPLSSSQPVFKSASGF